MSARTQASSEPFEVTVATLGGLGDGIASHNGKPLFIAKSCAGDVLKVRIVHENHDAFQGVITEVVSPGPFRQEAPCVYFDRCGGCTMQQLAPQHYKDFKTRVFQAGLTHAGLEAPDAVIEFLPAGTRRRVEFKVSHVGDRVALAFFEPRSHNPVVIKECLILRPELQAMIAPLNHALSAMALAKYLSAVSLTMADSGMEMVLTLKGFDIQKLPKLDDLCRQLKLLRISVRTPDSKPMVAIQMMPVEMNLGKYNITLPPDAFLQATVEGQAILTKVAVENTKSASKVVDLFSGIGTYSFPLSEFTHVHAVEGDTTMARIIRKSVQRHSIANVTAEQRDLFIKPLTAKELGQFDAAIINPPRVGAKNQCEQLAASSVSTVVMISCNPATFTRDAKILKSAGFKLVSVQGIDQFVWSQHLEIAAVFKRD